MLMHIYFIFFFAALVSSVVDHNPLTEPAFPVIQNQGFTREINKSYVRFPGRAKGVVRDVVWSLSQNSAGLYISFKTNSKDIIVKYTVQGSFGMPLMPNTGVSGMDLLALNPDTNKWSSVFTSFSFTGKQVVYNFNNIKEGEFEFRLYLPLYNTINNDLIITVNDGSSFTWISKIDYEKNKPIVAYGTSILQGSSASRPISAWPTILSRSLDKPLINFGFSGNALLEPEVINFIIENDASLYIVDTIPNICAYSPADIKKLVYNAVKQIREKRADVPILVAEHSGAANSETVQSRKDNIDNSNKAQREAYEQLVAEGVKGLHYLEREEFAMKLDAWTDLVHPNNYGMKIIADAYERKIHEILE